MKTDLLADYAVPFAAWEMRLYLDTHPDDRQAMAAYWNFCSQAPCRGNYACLSGRECTYDRWNWIDDPWPWEAEANPEVEEV